MHIADVSHYVEPDTVLDKEAYERATSVYLPDRVMPMLPEASANELCSLRPNEDKYTFSAIFQINKNGKVKEPLDGQNGYPFAITGLRMKMYRRSLKEQVATMTGGNTYCLNDMAQQFGKERFKKGAINFSSQEVRFKLDEKGKPIGIVVKESKEAHQLIEEFMLLANQTVAEYVSRIKVNNEAVPFPYRVHDMPDEEKLKPFAAFAKNSVTNLIISDARSYCRFI